MDKILAEIVAARLRQDAQWGARDHWDYRWLAILTEEVGEAARAILQRRGAPAVRRELLQAAAVIVAWLEMMDRR